MESYSIFVWLAVSVLDSGIDYYEDMNSHNCKGPPPGFKYIYPYYVTGDWYSKLHILAASAFIQETDLKDEDRVECSYNTGGGQMYIDINRRYRAR